MSADRTAFNRSWFHSTLSLLLILSLSACSDNSPNFYTVQTSPGVYAYDSREELQRVYQEIAAEEPEVVSAPEPLQRALLLRDAVHHRVPSGQTPNSENSPLSIFQYFVNSFTLMTAGHYCQGIGLIYLQGLRALGFTARAVGLSRSVGPDPLDTHSTSEVLIDGNWIVVDATFNISVEDGSGNKLGWVEALSRMKRGEPYEIVTDGFAVLPGRSIEEYYIPLAELAPFAVFSPHYLNHESHGGFSLPSAWDGTLFYPDDTTYNLLRAYSSSYYDFLRSPPPSDPAQ